MATVRNQGAKLEDQGNNIWRFMPAREVPGDNQIMFRSMAYARKAVVQEGLTRFTTGGVIGPNDQFPEVAETPDAPDLELSAGGVIIPARPNAQYEAVDIRPHRYTDDNGKKWFKQWIDWATFQKIGGQLFVMPYGDEREVYVEVWTGDIRKKTAATTFQFVQFGMFDHGSVAYLGDDMSLVNATSMELVRNKDGDGGPDVMPMTSSAELVRERRGEELAKGVHKWLARLWRIRYSPTESEMVLVRQLGRFWLLHVPRGQSTIDFEELPAEKARKFAKVFEAKTIDQHLVPVPGAQPVLAPAATG